MKKIVPLFVLVFSFIQSHAQTGKLQLGIEGGPDISTVINSGITTIGFNGGYFGGITGLYKLNDMASIKAGIDYDVIGFTHVLAFSSDDGNTIQAENYTHTLDYIQIPIMTRISFGEDVKFFMNGGPYFAYLLNANGYSPGIGTIPSNNMTETSYFKSFDLGLTGGIGLSIPLKKGWIIELEARGNLGALNASNNNPLLNGMSIENVSGALLVGLRYALH